MPGSEIWRCCKSRIRYHAAIGYIIHKFCRESGPKEFLVLIGCIPLGPPGAHWLHPVGASWGLLGCIPLGSLGADCLHPLLGLIGCIGAGLPETPQEAPDPWLKFARPMVSPNICFLYFCFCFSRSFLRFSSESQIFFEENKKPKLGRPLAQGRPANGLPQLWCFLVFFKEYLAF